jgi:hypothetical protein
MSDHSLYVFSAGQLYNLLDTTLEMFLEYRDQHGKDEDAAKVRAVREMFEGLDAEREMWDNGDVKKLSLQSQ